MPRLAISLFGPFHVTLEGASVTEFKTNKVQALLAYLAVEADRAHERASLARASEGSAATNVRTQPHAKRSVSVAARS